MITVKYIYSCGRTSLMCQEQCSSQMGSGTGGNRRIRMDISPSHCMMPSSRMCPTVHLYLVQDIEGGQRHWHSALCSFPIPCITLAALLKQTGVGQAGTQDPHDFHCHQSSP